MLFKIISAKILPLNQVALDDTNWAIKRAYYDGKLSELNNLLKLLDQGKED